MKQTYTIGELAEIAGVSTKTLRVYERKGLLIPERNAENGYRIYTEDAVRELEKIQIMKYLDFSLEQIEGFLQRYENVGREEMLIEQKRLLEKKREQLNSVISCVEQAIVECKVKGVDENTFLRNLSGIVKNKKADELVVRLGRHSDEPRGWSRFIFDQAKLKEGMQVLDAGAGYGNLWRYNIGRLPEKMQVTCIDKHNTHADGFLEYTKEKVQAGEISENRFRFVWNDLEVMEFLGKYDRIFFNHVSLFIQDRESLYRKFASVLARDGVLICTWGGYLLYENIILLLQEFLDDMSTVESKCNQIAVSQKKREKELREVFPVVEKHAYVTTLHFEKAEEFMDYIQQVCEPAGQQLEQRRNEFLQFLESRKNAQGGYEFVRDTFLFCCKKEV